MSVTAAEARKRARRLLHEHGVNDPPTPLERITQSLGIAVHYLPLDDELSGMAFIKDSKRIIVLNAGHHPNRQRFTLAHELGHHLLHADYLAKGVHVDKVILRRNVLSQQGADPKEIAANAFAAELLMPEEMVKSHMGAGLDFNDDDVVDRIARKFKVSTAALNYRLLTPPAKRQTDLFGQ